jgi:hypothetical protein
VIACVCIQCNKSFETPAAWIRKGGGKFCSRRCHNAAQTGTGISRHGDGYLLLKKPDHPRASSAGFVYVHILVAEQKLGRPLFPGETVHHRDHNVLNNEPENIEVFESRGEHTRHHCLERAIDSGVNPAKEKRCPSCRRVQFLTEFSPSSSRGRQVVGSYCKSCCVAKQRERRKKRRESGN